MMAVLGLVASFGLRAEQPKIVQAAAGSYGYFNPSPKATLSVGNNYGWSYSNALNKFSYPVFYTVQNVKDGSIRAGNTVLLNHIANNGSLWTPYIFAPNTTYTFNFYSESNGKGKVLATQIVTTPPPPPAYGYFHP